MKGVIGSIGWGVVSAIISGHFGLSYGENLALTVGGAFVITALTM